MWAAGCIFKELLELTPPSRFRTGALFPGRYCIPFSFDDDQRERQRHDQLAVITRTLGAPVCGTAPLATGGGSKRQHNSNRRSRSRGKGWVSSAGITVDQ